jgi:hypothetical protein
MSGQLSAAVRVCNWAKSWAQLNLQVTWTNWAPISALKLWYEANKTNANPPIPPTPSAGTHIVCYELPMYAAVCAGVLTPAALIALYKAHWADNKPWDEILMGGWMWHTYDVANHKPTPGAGDIVFFNRMSHVAISTGNSAQPGEIVSLWGMDTTGIAAGTPIEITTVEALYASVRQQCARVRRAEGIGQQSALGNAIPELKIEYTAPPW